MIIVSDSSFFLIKVNKLRKILIYSPHSSIWCNILSKKLDAIDIQNYLEDISKLGKSIANTKRVKILILLLNESRDFSTLIDLIKLKKTALSKHLTQLLANHLIEKRSRGTYHITEDGEKLINAIVSVYRDSRMKDRSQRTMLRKRYSDVLTVEKTVTMVSRQPVYQGGWITYLGALLGVLQSLGIEKEIDRASVGGYTGYVFALPNVFKGGICASGPTALAVWEEIVDGTKKLGFNIHQFFDKKGYPPQDKVTNEDRYRAKRLFELVKTSINNDKPVVLWGIDIPEYGIVKGYKGDFYIVSSYRRFNNLPEMPIRYDYLNSPGVLQAIFFNEKVTFKREEVDKEAINRAIMFSEGKKVYNDYIAGSMAYKEWANCLESKLEDDHPYHGNSFNGVCNLEAKSLACIFTKRLSEKYQGRSQSKFLNKASHKYSKIMRRLVKFQRMFPFAHAGDMPEDKLIEGAELLRACQPIESEALSFLKDSYNAWE